MWAGLDSNQRRREPADLQSAPVDRFGTDPLNLSLNTKISIKKLILIYFTLFQNIVNLMRISDKRQSFKRRRW